MGYFPSPVGLLDFISSYLSTASSGGRALDPCCGMGEALAHVATKIGASETWGAELSQERSKVAETVLTKVHHCAWQSCKVGRGAISLLYLNPPYDVNVASKIRLEQSFLEETSWTLCAGGILIYIIPQAQLGNMPIARHLAGRFDHIHIVRFPDEEFAPYKQVVVFGIKKHQYAAPNGSDVNAILHWAHVSAEQFSVLQTQAEAMYVVPPAPQRDVDGKQPFFRRTVWQPEELIEAAQREGVRVRSKAWRDAMNAINAEVVVHPAMPLKKGHVAMLMAAGLMGVMQLRRKVAANADGVDDIGNGGNDSNNSIEVNNISKAAADCDTHEESEPIVAKGRVIKTKRVETEEVMGADGHTLTKTIEKDIFVTSLALLDGQGNLEVIKDQHGLGRFMQTYCEQLTQQVVAKHAPSYDLHPTDAEWQAVSHIALGMRLPGRKEGGLLSTQKHIAIAAARVLRKSRAAFINAEMGLGKSLTSCAVLEVLRAYPAVVLCPPHLVRKWAAEIERGIPGAVARVVNCMEHLDDALEPDDEPVQKKNGGLPKLPPYSIMDFVREYRSGKLGTKAVAVLSRERAKLGSGWAPVAAVRKVWDADQAEWLRCLADPDTGQLLLDREKDGVPLLDDEAGWKFLSTNQRFSCTEPIKGWEVDDQQGKGLLRRTGVWAKRRVRTPMFTQGQGTGSFLNLPEMRDGALIAPKQHEHREHRVGFRRYPIASFIHRKLKGFFKLLIADEAHQFQAARSDQAIAFHQISGACRYTLGLTGTLFGGRSTSLFHLAHRTASNVRQEFEVNDERRWAQLYGVLEVTKWDNKETTEADDGAFSGYNRSRVIVRELPGISPAIVKHLLPQVVFARINDLGYALPPYQEQVVRLEMDPAQREHYWQQVYDPRNDAGRLYTLMIDALKEGDGSLVSVWLQTALARPNSCFRTDEVERLVSTVQQSGSPIDLAIAQQRRKLLRKQATHVQLMSLPPVVGYNEWLPKERWLIDYCQQQIAKGRKVLVYVRQTGTRDIQPRLMEVLRSAAIRVKTLHSNVKPENREAWVQANISSMDVLLTNPKLVETGLDLVMFHSIVFYEIEYSLYTLWQAMRRVWRLGQTRPVEVTFLSHRDALEDLALSLMGKKLYAAQLLYGDEVGGAIVESDDGSFLTELARAVVDKTKVEDLSALFADANQVEGVSTAESVIEAEPVPVIKVTPIMQQEFEPAPQPSILTMEAMRNLAKNWGGLRGRKRTAKLQTPQMSFFGEEMGESLVQLALEVEA